GCTWRSSWHRLQRWQSIRPGTEAVSISFRGSFAGVGHVVGQADEASHLLGELRVPAVAEVAGQSQGRREVVTGRGNHFPGTLLIEDLFGEDVVNDIQ